MKLYVTEAVNAEGKRLRTWTTSGSAAATARATYTREHKIPRAEIQTKEGEIDTRKEGLVEFLNKLSADSR